jgi:signal transduction histidine kinase
MRQELIEGWAAPGAPAARDGGRSRGAPLFADLRALLSPAPTAWPPESHRPFDLDAALADALAECAPYLSRAIVAQRIRQSAVRGCAGQITRVLVHLLRNAAQATAAAGRPAVIRIDVRRDGARVQVRVTDNGHGIAPPVMARLFEPFFSTRARGGAPGLGLTFSRAVVRAHGGELRCANRSPHGAHFEFDLPAATEPTP